MISLWLSKLYENRVNYSFYFTYKYNYFAVKFTVFWTTSAAFKKYIALIGKRVIATSATRFATLLQIQQIIFSISAL